MAKHITYIPNCPKCGTELVRCGAQLPDTVTDDNPFGRMSRWWVCPKCEYKSDRGDDWEEFEEITRELTAEM